MCDYEKVTSDYHKNICSILRNCHIFMNAKVFKIYKLKLLDEAISYFDEIDEKIKAKFFKSFEKVESGHKGDWLKHLEDEIWEFRERDSSKFY